MPAVIIKFPFILYTYATIRCIMPISLLTLFNLNSTTHCSLWHGPTRVQRSTINARAGNIVWRKTELSVMSNYRGVENTIQVYIIMLVVKDGLNYAADPQLFEVRISLPTYQRRGFSIGKPPTCPVPRNIIGCPVTYVIDNAAPTCTRK